MIRSCKIISIALVVLGVVALVVGCIVKWEKEFNNPLDAKSTSHVELVLPGFSVSHQEDTDSHGINGLPLPLGSKLRLIAKQDSAGERPDSVLFRLRIMDRNNWDQSNFDTTITTTRGTVDVVLDTNFLFYALQSMDLSGMDNESFRFECRLSLDVYWNEQLYQDESWFVPLHCYHPMVPFVGSTVGPPLRPKAGVMGEPMTLDVDVAKVIGSLQADPGEQIDSLAWDLDRDGVVDSITRGRGIQYTIPQDITTDLIFVRAYLHSGHEIVLWYVMYDSTQMGGPDVGSLVGPIEGNFQIDSLYLALLGRNRCGGGNYQFQPGSRVTLIMAGRAILFASEFVWQIDLNSGLFAEETTQVETLALALDSLGSYTVRPVLLSGDTVMELPGYPTVDFYCGHKPASNPYDWILASDAQSWSYRRAGDSIYDTVRVLALGEIHSALCTYEEVVDARYHWDLDYDGTVDTITSFPEVARILTGSPPVVSRVGVWYELNDKQQMIYDVIQRSTSVSLNGLWLPWLDNSDCHGGWYQFQPGTKLSVAAKGQNLASVDTFLWEIDIDGGKSYDTTFIDTLVITLAQRGTYGFGVTLVEGDSTLASIRAGEGGSFNLKCESRNFGTGSVTGFWAVTPETLELGQPTDTMVTMRVPGKAGVSFLNCLSGNTDSVEVTGFQWDLDGDTVADTSTVDSFLTRQVTDTPPTHRNIGIWYVLNNGMHYLYDMIKVIERQRYELCAGSAVSYGYGSQQVVNALDMEFINDTLWVLDQHTAGVGTLFVKGFVGDEDGNLAWAETHQLTANNDKGWLGEAGTVLLPEGQSDTAWVSKYNFRTNQLVASWGENGHIGGKVQGTDVLGIFYGGIQKVVAHSSGAVMTWEDSYNRLQIFDSNGTAKEQHGNVTGHIGVVGDSFWTFVPNRNDAVRYYSATTGHVTSIDTILENIYSPQNSSALAMSSNYLYFYAQNSWGFSGNVFVKFRHDKALAAVTPDVNIVSAHPSRMAVDRHGNIFYYISDIKCIRMD